MIHSGPVELAAVGVSIALFNQVSRIAIFPLVSITTSFVAEEDTIGKVSTEAQESESLEAGSLVNSESKELIPQNGTTNHIPLSSLSVYDRPHQVEFAKCSTLKIFVLSSFSLLIKFVRSLLILFVSSYSIRKITHYQL